MDDLSKSISAREIESIMAFPKRNLQAQIGPNSKGKIDKIVSNLFKTKAERVLHNLFYDGSIIPVLKLDKDITRK